MMFMIENCRLQEIDNWGGGGGGGEGQYSYVRVLHY